MISESALDRLRGLLGEPETMGTRYEVLSMLGRGGMGIVYLARDSALDREVALKVLERDAEADPTIAARLAQEARILGRLEHPGIVPVHDFGRLADGRLFYAMKRVRGEGLDRWMTSVDLPARLAVFLRICEAVSFAHAQGVIHRDLKPENVMIGEFGEVLVLDWGVARLLESTRGGGAADVASGGRHQASGELASDAAGGVTDVASGGRHRASGEPASDAAGGAPFASTPALTPRATGWGAGLSSWWGTVHTAHGTVVGTPAYMAPEQARGDVLSIDQRTDVYALGAMLEALSGSAAGAGALRAIARKARAERPHERYQTVVELAADVSRFVSGLAVRARGEPVLDRVARVVRRYRTPLLLILTYLLVRLLLFWAFRV